MTAHPPRNLVLLGGGLAHVHLLERLRQHPLPGVQVTLVTPQIRLVHSGMLAGFVAGHHAQADCVTALEPLVQQSGARWVAARAMALDAQANALRLDDGSVLNFDWLSLCQEPVQDRHALERALPGAREHGLFVRPLDAFCALWPRVPELAAAKALRVAVIGGTGGRGHAEVGAEGGAAHHSELGAEGASKARSASQPIHRFADADASDGLAIELALAIRHRLPGSAVTLVTGGAPLVHGCPPMLQKRLAQALRQRNVTVLADYATHIDSGEITLGSGARLACDVPLLATRPNAPAWLADSGLALDGQGWVAVDACGRSTSHANVFAAGPSNAAPALASARRTHAVAARFAANLAAAATGQSLRPHAPAIDPFRLVSCGDGHAIAAWGGYGAQGRWAGWLKRRMDRVLAAGHRGFEDKKGL